MACSGYLTIGGAAVLARIGVELYRGVVGTGHGACIGKGIRGVSSEFRVCLNRDFAADFL